MPVVLGIDTSLRATGMCLVSLPPSVELGSWHGQCVTVGAPAATPDKSKRAMARRVKALVDQIRWVFDDDRPDLVVMETLAFAAKGEGVWVLPWIFGKVIELCEEFDVELLCAGTSQVKKYATGKGNADKDTVMLTVAKRWPELAPANNNEADAACLAAIGCHYLGQPLGEPTVYQTEVLDKIGP
ncbi:RuvC-like resolvase [Mycobacterium phage Surely]|nr:RuvC-like resolvase [Mycobacterium phage Surely]